MVTLKRVTGATGAVPDGSGLSSGRWRLETAGTGIFQADGPRMESYGHNRII